MPPDILPTHWTTHLQSWLLSDNPQIRSHAAMSGLALFLMGSCVAVFLWLAQQGHAPLPWVAAWSVVSLGGLLAAALSIRLGWTQSLQDPALTLAQVLWAISSVAVAYVLSDAVRDVLPGMVAMVLLFGSLGLSRRQIIGITSYAFASTGSAMLLVPVWLQQAVSAVDIAHTLMLAVVLLACMAVSLRLHTSRSRLQEQRHSLKRALEEHRTLASRDTLTSLPNRRSMTELLELEQRRCQRGSRSMALAVLDIDHFKRINDSHGHAVGDRALQVFANTVRQVVRGSDVLARWGGEEFVLLLSDMQADAAQQLLERIGTAVSQAVVPDAPAGLRMTVSAGLTVHQPGEPIAATLERADQALYRAKHQGRNCVVLANLQAASAAAPPSPPSPPPMAPVGLGPVLIQTPAALSDVAAAPTTTATH